jgi:acyl carrier protein
VSDIETEVKDFVAKTLNIAPERVKPESRFAEDFGTDSLTMIELVVSFEERFEVAVSEEESAKVSTVGDVIEFLRRKRAGAEADARRAG